MKMLKAKLLELKEREQKEKIEDYERRADGNQVGQPDPVIRLLSLTPWLKTTAPAWKRAI
jgi:hypothetical protein